MIEWSKIPRFECSGGKAVCLDVGEVCLDWKLVWFPVGWVCSQPATRNQASLLRYRLIELNWPRHAVRHYTREQLDLLADSGEVTKFRRALMLAEAWLYDRAMSSSGETAISRIVLHFRCIARHLFGMLREFYRPK